MKVKKILSLGILTAVAISGLVVFLVNKNVAKAPADTKKVTDTPKIVKEVVYPVLLTPEQASELTVVVNKKHKLPNDYVPALEDVLGGQMRPEAAAELRKLFAAANSDGISLSVISAYRSYDKQVSVYNSFAEQYGQDQADTFSMRPGHSEHQTGLTVDVGNSDGSCSLDVCFGDTPAGKWLESNVANYGFIIRYPEGKETETGLQYEPWHIRYVGVDLAKVIASSGKTLDQYFNVPAGNY